ncbi:hypothetical protein HanIR_Chr12g0599151 [Helianthus annuus]|nr:hypothetical protein HanIR_Chr12g0599151 [Helianthus annuus]
MTQLVTSQTTTLVALPAMMLVALVAFGVVPSVSTLPLTTRRLLTRTLVVIGLSLLGLRLNCSRTLARISIPLALVITGSISSSSANTLGQLVLLNCLISETVS